MSKHTAAFKLQVVNEYLTGRAGYQSVALAHGLDGPMVRRWVARFRSHGAPALDRKYGHYDANFKLAVLKRINRDHLSHRQAAALFDIREASAIGKWARQYDEGGISALAPRPRSKPKRMKAPPTPPDPRAGESTTLSALRKENEYLRAEVAYLKKLEALARGTMASPKRRKPSSS